MDKFEGVKPLIDFTKDLTQNEAMKLLRSDIIALLYKQPYYASLLIKMKKIITYDLVKVAGVAIIDGEIHLYINPKTFFNYTLEERIFILIHETLHIVLNHPYRKENKKHPLWNAATDVAINQMIENKYAHMPKNALQVNSWKEKHDFVLPKNLSADEYYKILKDKKIETEHPRENKHSGTNEHQNDPSDSSNSPQSRQGEKEDQEPSSSISEQVGCTEEEGNSKKPSLDDLHPTWDMSSAMPEDVADKIIKDALQDALNATAGKLPNEIKEIVNGILTSKINWQSHFRNFIAKKRNTNTKSTWKRRNRRFGDEVMGRKKTRKLKIAVGLDSSTSITTDNFKAFNGELRRMYKNGVELIVLECDTKVHSIYKYKPTDTQSFKGRGGTDFRPVFEAIEKKEHKLLKDKPDAVVFLTDGFGTAPEYFNIPTLWCLTEGGSPPTTPSSPKVPWGQFIKMEN
jgi:predicted metal-dependent peptidase